MNVNYSNGVFFGEILFYFVVMLNEYVFIELLFCYNVNVYVCNYVGYMLLYVVV